MNKTSEQQALLARARQIGYIPSACLTEVTVKELLDAIGDKYPEQVAAMNNRELLKCIRATEAVVRKTIMDCVAAAVSSQFKGKEVHHAI